tara:strand:- start:313 stop:1041 length:729 start_codon:yes stop_codon:yes gene_type:complete
MISIPKINKLNLKKRLFLSILLSIFIHILTIILIDKNLQINTKGDKFIPIEVLIQDSKAGAGESLERQVKKDLRTIGNVRKIEEKDNEKEILRQEEKKNSIKKKIKKENSNKQTNKIFQKSNTKYTKRENNKKQIKMGSKYNNIENNIPERGSVKGKGKIKITCFDCKTPKYPPKALRRGVEGSPLIKVWINKKGDVIKSIVIKTSANKSIDNAAIKAASESKFYPIQEESTLNIEYNLKIR